MQRLDFYTLPIDQNGRIVIPKPYRDTLGLTDSRVLRMAIDGDRLILENGKAVCKFCGDINTICTDFPICEKCLSKANVLKEKLSEINAVLYNDK